VCSRSTRYIESDNGANVIQIYIQDVVMVGLSRYPRARNLCREKEGRWPKRDYRRYMVARSTIFRQKKKLRLHDEGARAPHLAGDW